MKPSDFNKKAKFGMIKTVKNENTGSSKKEFVATCELWFAPKTRSLAMQYKLQGTDLESTREIIVRHNSSVDNSMVVQIGDDRYDVVNISSDDTNQTISYDYITLKKVGG
ncbi:phage head closure protein [Weissella coleopterorum]|uniref:Phage head closure protein n=1 Tax=Weissella coleopterorum TaxID=2714949 RepID=A0A6G8AXS0_9LACO|nr:phage head closure protein [Weissella coleopterorum]QIL49858.1 phage head closure protein [Weissella coleopterorum]